MLKKNWRRREHRISLCMIILDTYIKLGNPARAKLYYEKALKFKKNAVVEDKLKAIRGTNGNGNN